MMIDDALPISTTAVDVRKIMDDFHHQIIASGPSADKIIQGAMDYPDSPLIQTYAAAFYLYGQSDETTRMAQTYLFNAEKNLRHANLREKLFYEAVYQWMSLAYESALTIFETITQLYPKDTLALKFAEWLYYCTGQAYQAEHYLNVCLPMVPHHLENPYFLSMYSFALELSGDLSQANAIAEKAISLNLNTPWAHHTLAHYYLNSGQITQGISRLKILQPTWETVFPLLRGHNTWHLALFYLSQQNQEDVLALYPSIFGTLPDVYLEQLDAISLLWRLDLAGLAQQSRYQDIIQHIGDTPNQSYVGFNNAHYIYGLVRAGENNRATIALKKMKQHAQKRPPSQNKHLWQSIIIPFCEGIQAFANEEYPKAYRQLHPIIDDCYQLGGSDAQDELFTQTYLVTLLKLNKKNEARAFFLKTLKHYEGTALESYWFNA